MNETKENSSLPEGWKWVKLGEVCKTTSGGTPSRSEQKFYNGNIPWVKSGELAKGLILDTEEKISEEAIKNSSAKVFPKGTLLIALYGATIGKLAFLGVDAATNQAICGIYKNENVSSQFLYNYLFYKKQKLVDQGIGGAQPNISQTILKNLEIHLPPKPIQQAIVSKIEELFSELDKSIETLRLAQQQLKTYRQAVLKRAFEGKLTEEWRKENGTSVQIQSGSQKTYVVSSGLEPELIAAEPLVDYYVASNNIAPGELPDGWKIEYLGNISEMCLGKMLDKQKNKGVLKPYLGNINVRWGNFDLTNLQQMKFEEKEQERFQLRKGDLVICEGGEPGRCAVWKHEKIMMIQKALHRVRAFENADVKYVYYFFKYSAYSGALKNSFTGTTIKHLTGKELKKIKIPITSIKEQNQIVQEVETRFSIADKMEESIIQSLQQAESLRQSILKKVFEGKLIDLKIL